MSRKEVLEKAIRKALDNGWDDIYPNETWGVRTDRGLGVETDMVSPYTGNIIWGYQDFKEIIFDHDFAKALWGEAQHTDKLWEKLSEPTGNGRDYLLNVMPAWQYHLQRMVIAEDPIKYLEKNI